MGLYSQIFPLIFIYLFSSKYSEFLFMVYYSKKSLLLLILLEFWKLVLCKSPDIIFLKGLSVGIRYPKILNHIFKAQKI